MLLRSIKEADYFTQLMYEALVVIEKERQRERIKENMDKSKSQGISQAHERPKGRRSIFNNNL